MEINFTNISSIFAIISLVMSILLYLEVVDDYQLYFNFDLIIHNKEYWRLFTSLFHFGRLGLGSIFNVYLFLTYLTQLESLNYQGLPLDFICFIIFGSVFIWIFAIKFSLTFLGSILVDYVLYYWSKIFPDNRVLALFFVPIPAGYIPIYHIVVVSIFNSSSPNFFKTQLLPCIYCILISHIYFFLHDVINTKYDVPIFRFPIKLNRIINSLFQ